MDIINAPPKEYLIQFPKPYHIFNTVEFNQLNQSKVDEVNYLLFKDNKVRFGLIVGLKDNSIKSPFSAPFGGFSFKDEGVQISKIEEALKTFDDYCIEHKIDLVKLVIPPNIYNNNFINKYISCLFRQGYKQEYLDLNFSFNTKLFDNNYLNNIWRNARKNYHISEKNKFQFKKTNSLDQINLAYQIIQKNRESKGFPLRMSLEQVLDTIKIIKSDSFLVYLDNQVVASAIVFYIQEKIVQVIYWGDLPEFYHHKTMNFLSYKVFEYYQKLGIDIVDIGPSTDEGNPNYGLCEFKESIGCEISLKYTFSKNFL